MPPAGSGACSATAAASAASSSARAASSSVRSRSTTASARPVSAIRRTHRPATPNANAPFTRADAVMPARNAERVVSPLTSSSGRCTPSNRSATVRLASAASSASGRAVRPGAARASSSAVTIRGLLVGRVRGGDVAHGDLHEVDQPPPGDERGVAVEPPPAVLAGGPQERRVGHRARERHPAPQPARRGLGQSRVPERGQRAHRPVVLHPGERRGQAAPGEHLGDGGQRRGLRQREAVEPRACERREVRRRDHPAGVDLRGGRLQDVVGERCGPVEQGGHATIVTRGSARRPWRAPVTSPSTRCT